ncbi:MAG: ABC transporter ATP-binding protein/permease [Bacteroidales bacterium]|nr:ABC transporter ATP-binding protein/permease [Bacteroidales bacterium]
MKRFWELIPENYRRGAIAVAALVPVNAALGLVGAAALLPLMMTVLDSESLPYPRQAVILAVMLLIVVKNILGLGITWVQNRYLMALYRNFSSRLFTSLYSRGLLYIKNQNSASMTFNVIGVCYNFVMGWLGAWMNMIGEMLFVFFMLVAVFIYSPKATLLSLAAFAPVLLLYFLMVRKPIKAINREVNNERREQHKLVSEAFRGYSEIQVNSALPGIRQRFGTHLDRVSQLRIRVSLIQNLPPFMLEFCVVLMVAVIMLLNLSPGSENMLFLGVVCVVLLKLLPAVRSIISCISAITANQYSCEVVADIEAGSAEESAEEDAAPMGFEDNIELRELSFRFPEDTADVISNLNLKIAKGERLGIKGRTGAGKTTLFNLLLGLYPPSRGAILVDGKPLTQENVASWHAIVGYVPQNVFVEDSTILENVALGRNPESIDRQKAEQALRQASLWEFISSLPQGMDSRIGEAGCRMSGGQKQRLGIARALYRNAKVLFFDEATSSLDAATEKEINAAIEKLSATHRELTIIIISHRESTLAFCDRIMEM